MSNYLTPEEAKGINDFCQAWATATRRAMDGRLVMSTARIQNVNKYRYGLIEALGFKFPRHGVFVEMGVFGGLSKKEATAQGKLRPRPWFNPVMEARIPKLIDGLAEKSGDLVINAQRILIKNTN
jgi:hypothetical protein